MDSRLFLAHFWGTVLWSDLSSFFHWFCSQKWLSFLFPQLGELYKNICFYMFFTILRCEPAHCFDLVSIWKSIHFLIEFSMEHRWKFVQKSVFFATSILYAFLYEFCSIVGGFRAEFGLHWGHFGRLGLSWTASWVPLGASWRVLSLLWTTKL